MDFLVVLWLACGIACAYIASQKGRDFVGWLFVGVLGGLIALIVIASIPKIEKEDAQ